MEAAVRAHGRSGSVVLDKSHPAARITPFGASKGDASTELPPFREWDVGVVEMIWELMLLYLQTVNPARICARRFVWTMALGSSSTSTRILSPVERVQRRRHAQSPTCGCHARRSRPRSTSHDHHLMLHPSTRDVHHRRHRCCRLCPPRTYPVRIRKRGSTTWRRTMVTASGRCHHRRMG